MVLPRVHQSTHILCWSPLSGSSPISWLLFMWCRLYWLIYRYIYSVKNHPKLYNSRSWYPNERVWKGYRSVLLISCMIKMQGNAPLGIYATYDLTPDLSLSLCSGYTSCEPILPLICILLSHWSTSAVGYSFPELKEGSRCFVSHWPFWERNPSLTWQHWMFLAACASCWHFALSRC